MASRNLNGSIITQSNNVLIVHQQSDSVKIRNTQTDEQTASASNSS